MKTSTGQSCSRWFTCVMLPYRLKPSLSGKGVSMRNSIFLLILVLAFVMAGCPQTKMRKRLPPLFVVTGALETGADPSFLITDDFNNDGNLDLVVANSGDHTFSYFKGKGDGTFKDQQLFKTDMDPICIAGGDFNKDGYLDLAVISYGDQTLQIFLNNQIGGFRNTGQKIKPGKIPINLTAGDFNHDGLADLAVSLRYHKVVILMAKGKGRFSEPEIIPVKGQPTGLVIGDYNHDNHVDVAIALAGSGNTGVQLLWGKGDGTFKPSKNFKGGGQPLTIANIDVNGDGYNDLVTSSNGRHALTLVMNNKDESFKALRDFASGNFPKFAAVADFTGDGVPDLAVTNPTDDLVSVSLCRGDVTFVYPPIFHIVDEYPQGLVSGDFNNDGLIDLAVSCRDKQLIDILTKRNMVNPLPNPPATPKNA